METDMMKSESDENPLRTLLWVGLMGAIFYIFSITKMIFTEGFEKVLSEKAHVLIELLLIASFIITYHRRSIYAWWITIFYLPISWGVVFVFYKELLVQGFPIVVNVFMFSFLYFYLIKKYRPYKSYITKKALTDIERVDK